jgi:hypothetical protein
MHVATSIPSIIQKTAEALLLQHSPKTLEEAGVQVSSLTWVSLQFCAKNQLAGRALNYTCALKLAHKVQQRTLRATSIDSHYVSAAYKYMRSYGLWLSKLLDEARCFDMSVISASCDDKCKVLPPSFPQLLKSECVIWHMILLCRSTLGSRHCPSNHHRGASLALCLLDTTLLSGKHISGRLGLLALFLELDLGTIVVMRTAPTQSWGNLVERVMSILNLGMQGVALARQEMEEVYEKDFKKCNGMSLVRKVAEAHDVGDVEHQQQQQHHEQQQQQ